MVCPRWGTAIQPIALPTWSKYLERVARGRHPALYEIGGAEVTTYREMIAA